MWYPPPVLVPFYFQPNLRTSSDVSTTMMWQFMPFDQRVYLAMNEVVGNLAHSLSAADERTFLLNKSVFDLIKVNHCLELTDPKLLGWYLSLPVEDRKLIQEQGGLLHFLQTHPALDVSRHIVHLKEQIVGNCLPLPGIDMSSKLNKSRRPTFYGVLRCLNCGTSCPSGAKNCRRCNELVINSNESVGISEEEKRLWLLPNNVREELNLVKAKKIETFESKPEQLGCIQNTSNDLPSQITSANSSQQAFDGGFAAQASLDQQRMHSTKAQLLSQMWEEGVWCNGTDVTAFRDPLAQASFSLDVELDMQSHNQMNGQGQVSMPAGNEADFACLDQETVPEYYSFNSTGLEHSSAQWSDATEALELCCSNSTMATEGSTEVSAVEHAESSPAYPAQNCTFPDSASCMSNSSEWTDVTEDYQDLSNEDELQEETKVDECHGPIDGGSSLVTHSRQDICSTTSINSQWGSSRADTLERDPACEDSFVSLGYHEQHVETTTKNDKCDVSPVPLLVNQAVDASSDFRDCFTCNQATETSRSFFTRPCRDVGSGSDSFTINREQETQTVQVSTYEKCTITEVYMSDLDVLSEEFEKLKNMEKEFKLLKETVASGVFAEGAGGELHKRACTCDAVQRATRAELRLLALQFAMCLQHCWRRYYTSPQGEAALQGTEALPDVMAQTLKCLEEDYFELKRKILAGVPLEKLKPLSVDSLRIVSGTCYTPALISEAYLGDVLHEASSRSPNGLEDEGNPGQVCEGITMGEVDGGLLSRTTTSQGFTVHRKTRETSRIHERVEHQARSSEKSRAVSVFKQQPIVSCETKAELIGSEAWFDAEEELVSSGQICKEQQEVGWRDREKLEKQEAASEKKSQSSLLCITGISSDVTECDLLLWFEKYHANKVCITTFSNNRSAIVRVRSPSDAKAAVREVSGRSVQGRTLHVEHIQRPIKESCSEHPPDGHKTGYAGQGLSRHDLQSSAHFSRPLRCSLEKLTNICDTPTASGTCVPQHYATMGSFDTIMARLAERHPEVSRQRIVGALLDLRAKHQHVLSGLPLREIVDMTSDLLTESTTK